MCIHKSCSQLPSPQSPHSGNEQFDRLTLTMQDVLCASLRETNGPTPQQLDLTPGYRHCASYADLSTAGHSTCGTTRCNTFPTRQTSLSSSDSEVKSTVEDQTPVFNSVAGHFTDENDQLRRCENNIKRVLQGKLLRT